MRKDDESVRAILSLRLIGLFTKPQLTAVGNLSRWGWFTKFFCGGMFPVSVRLITLLYRFT
jgi:hypothetical protein